MEIRKSKRPESREMPVDGRYSFHNRAIGRGDFSIRQGLHSRRIITYPTPPKGRREFRDAMIEKGLVLGQKDDSQKVSGLDHFLVPTSARPISHEGRSSRRSNYTYSDAVMFGDLGRLLGKLAQESPDHPLVLTGDIGSHVAFVQFTQVDEEKILLVPGFEMGLDAVEDDDAALSLYAKKLYDEFPQLDLYAGNFTEGFHEAVAGVN